MMKWLAIAFVVFGCGYLGISYAGTIEIRVRQLEILERMFCQLEFSVGFLAQPFWQALKSVAEGYSGVMSQLFSSVAEQLENNRNMLPEIAFQRVADKTAGVQLRKEEREILQEFFRHVGRGDRENTRDGIRMTVAKLRLVRESVIREQEKDGKLWRSMGFLGGLLIVLLLV